MKLYRVSVTLTGKGFSTDTAEWEAIEKNKTYQARRVDRWGEVMIRNIKKEKIHLIQEGSWINGINQIGFIAWCFESEIKEWEEACKRYIIKVVRSYKDSLESLLNHIPELKNSTQHETETNS